MLVDDRGVNLFQLSLIMNFAMDISGPVLDYRLPETEHLNMLCDSRFQMTGMHFISTSSNVTLLSS